MGVNYSKLLLCLQLCVVPACGSSSFSSAPAKDSKDSAIAKKETSLDGSATDTKTSKTPRSQHHDSDSAHRGSDDEPSHGDTDGGGGEGGGDEPDSDSGSNDDPLRWEPGQIITNMSELEECKADIYARTKDYSLCLKCFSEFMLGGGKITDDRCGCAKTVIVTREDDDTP
jgi:hypothetical protein